MQRVLKAKHGLAVFVLFSAFELKHCFKTKRVFCRAQCILRMADKSFAATFKAGGSTAAVQDLVQAVSEEGLVPGGKRGLDGRQDVFFTASKCVVLPQGIV